MNNNTADVSNVTKNSSVTMYIVRMNSVLKGPQNSLPVQNPVSSVLCYCLSQHKYLCVHTHIILDWRKFHFCLSPTHSSSLNLLPHSHCAPPTLSPLKALPSLNFTYYCPSLYLTFGLVICLPTPFFWLTVSYTNIYLIQPKKTIQYYESPYLPGERNKAILPKTICYQTKQIMLSGTRIPGNFVRL